MLVNTRSGFLALMERVRNERRIFFDTETSGLYPHLGARICGLVIGFDEGEPSYVPIRHQTDDPQLDPDWVMRKFANALSYRTHLIVGHNIKFDAKMALADFVDLRDYAVDGLLDDTMIMSHLLDETRFSHALKKLGVDLLGHDADAEEQELKAYIKANGIDVDATGYACVPVMALADYACQDIVLTRSLYFRFADQLREEGMRSTYRREQGVLNVVIDMELGGIAIDRDFCRSAIGALDAAIPPLRSRLEGYAAKAGVNTGPRLKKNGEPSKAKQADPFLSSTKVPQIANALGLHSPTFSEKTGAESWSKDVLKAFRDIHPFAADLVNYRFLTKLKSTYFEAFLAKTEGDVPLMAEFNQIATRTGRFSSRNPNLQNLPRPNPAQAAYEVKGALVPRPGYVFLLGDYSAMEVRMLAAITKEASLIENLRKGDDPHVATARSVFAGFDDADAEERERLRTQAKTLNFALLYGAGPDKLQQMLGLGSIEEGKDLRDRYFAALPAVKAFRSSLYRQLDITQPTPPPNAPADWTPAPYSGSRPTLRNIYGRQYHFNVLNYSEPRIKNRPVNGMWQEVLEWRYCADSHAALNYLVQGASADLVKEKMIAVHAWLKGEDARLVLQVHDELVIECRERDLGRFAVQLRATLEDCPKLPVPMPVDLSVARTNWAEKEKLELPLLEVVT